MNAFRFLILCCVVIVCAAFVVMPGRISAAVSTIYYVDADATGTNNGSSWADAFTDLQNALDAALPGDEIWVAAGTYKPSVEVGGSGARFKTFQMKYGVSIFGGFDPSVGDDEFSERDWENNATILSGDIGVEGNNADNCFHVFYHPPASALDESASLDGFTITHGNAQGAQGLGYSPYGGGMYNRECDPRILNCKFEDNYAVNGGGMYNEFSSPIISECIFMGNMSDRGGGMYSGGYLASPNVSNCTFAANTAVFDGGAMYNSWCDRGPVTITDCVFTENVANMGGGIYSIETSLNVTESTFSGNTAADDGGGMYSLDGGLSLTNCIFFDNSADDHGGGMYNDSVTPTIINCTFSNNSANYGGGMSNYSGAGVRATYCTFTGNTAGVAGAIYNKSHSSSVLDSCTFTGNRASTNGGVMVNINSDPRATNCIFMANTAKVGGVMFTDETSDPVLINCTLTKNVAEEQGGAVRNCGHTALTNCILWGDTPDEVSNKEYSGLYITYTDIEGGYPGTAGNINADPVFYDPANGDVRLTLGSPCIDTGTNAGVSFPCDGNGDGIAITDMGADEWCTGGPTAPIPEAGTILLMSLGLLGLGGIVLWRIRKRSRGFTEEVTSPRALM